jgi:hypothetical protein
MAAPSTRVSFTVTLPAAASGGPEDDIAVYLSGDVDALGALDAGRALPLVRTDAPDAAADASGVTLWTTAKPVALPRGAPVRYT